MFSALGWYLEFTEFAECNLNFKRLPRLTFLCHASQMENQITRVSELLLGPFSWSQLTPDPVVEFQHLSHPSSSC